MHETVANPALSIFYRSLMMIALQDGEIEYVKTGNEMQKQNKSEMAQPSAPHFSLAAGSLNCADCLDLAPTFLDDEAQVGRCTQHLPFAEHSITNIGCFG